MRIAELALEHHLPVVQQSEDHHRARMADVLAQRLAAVGQAHAVAVHLEQPTRVHQLALQERLDEVLAHYCENLMASRQTYISVCGRMPMASSARLLALSSTRAAPRCPTASTPAAGSSKYMSFTTRR